MNKGQRTRWNPCVYSKICVILRFLLTKASYVSHVTLLSLLLFLPTHTQCTKSTIAQEALRKFHSVPGFAKLYETFKKTHTATNRGAEFEMEIMLYLHDQGYTIEVCGLEIECYKKKYIKCMLNGKETNIGKTEFDTLAYHEDDENENIATECKSNKKLNKKRIKIAQFIKERTMLYLMRQLYSELQKETLFIKQAPFRTRKGRPIIFFWSPTTFPQPVALLSNWVNDKDEDVNIQRWKDIIKLLGHKTLRLYFKNVIPRNGKLKEDLDGHRFDYEDGVSLYRHREEMKNLIEGFSKLSFEN